MYTRNWVYTEVYSRVYTVFSIFKTKYHNVYLYTRKSSSFTVKYFCFLFSLNCCFLFYSYYIFFFLKKLGIQVYIDEIVYIDAGKKLYTRVYTRCIPKEPGIQSESSIISQCRIHHHLYSFCASKRLYSHYQKPFVPSRDQSCLQL